MACCEEKLISDIYVPLNKRLLDFGSEIIGPQLMFKCPQTMIWIFTFYYDEDMCDDCKLRFSAMNHWFQQYELFDDPIRNVKWIVEDEPNKNLIFSEIGFTKTPMHIFCRGDGSIIDIVTGFPEPRWLTKYILPIIQESQVSI